jgi:hypothetical protein
MLKYTPFKHVRHTLIYRYLHLPKFLVLSKNKLSENAEREGDCGEKALIILSHIHHIRLTLSRNAPYYASDMIAQAIVFMILFGMVGMVMVQVVLVLFLGLTLASMQLFLRRAVSPNDKNKANLEKTGSKGESSSAKR